VAGGFRFKLKPTEIESGGAQSMAEMTPTEATTVALERIIMPRFKLRDTTLSEALDQLQATAHAGGLPKDQFRFRYVTPEELPTPALRWVKVRTEILSDGSERVVEEPAERGTINERSAPVDVLETRITVELTNLPLIEAIKYVVSFSDLTYRIEGNEICLYQREATPRGLMIFRRMRSNPSFVLGTKSGADRVDLRPFFQSLGVRFCEGARAELLPKKGVILMLLPKDEDDLLQESFGCGGMSSAPPPSYLDRIKAYLPSWMQF